VTDPPAKSIDETARNDQVAGGSDMSDRLIAARRTFAEFAAHIEQVLAMLQEQAQELSRQQAHCAAMESSLSADRQQLEQIAAENRQREARLAAQAARLQDLEAELTARAEAVAQRERAVERLQSAILEISQTLTEADAELVREGLSVISAPGEAPAVTNLGDEAAQASGPQTETEAVSPVLEVAAEQAKPQDVQPAPVTEEYPEESSPVPIGEPQAQVPEVQPEADGSVDESTLDPQTRERLRVMRRLTGGRVPDVELLARIRGEQRASGPSTEPAQRKSKRRWWGG